MNLARLIAFAALAQQGALAREEPSDAANGGPNLRAAVAQPLYTESSGVSAFIPAGLRSVSPKAWLIACYFVALIVSGTVRLHQGRGAAAVKAAGKLEGPCGRQPASIATPAPSEVSETQPLLPEGKGARTWEKVEVVVILLSWMVVSPAFIMLNKWCFSKGGFPYPVTLTAMHMGSCFLVFGAMSWLPKGVRSRIMPDVDTSIPWVVYFKGLVPVALFMAVSLGFGNVALMYASVIFIQLVKPLNIVITSIAAFAWGLEVPTTAHLITVTVVAGGVILAAFGGAEFSLMGLLCQLIASASEGLRLIILQGVMQTNLKLDPVTTVYRFAPLAGLTLCLMSCVLEKPLDLAHVHSPGMLLLNCASAVLLNILIALVISRTSAVVSVLAGIAKDIGTIFVSSSLFSRPVTSTDVLGYCISLTGICMYKVYKDRLSLFLKQGFIGGWREVVRDLMAPPEIK